MPKSQSNWGVFSGILPPSLTGQMSNAAAAAAVSGQVRDGSARPHPEVEVVFGGGGGGEEAEPVGAEAGVQPLRHDARPEGKERSGLQKHKWHAGSVEGRKAGQRRSRWSNPELGQFSSYIGLASKTREKWNATATSIGTEENISFL